MVNYHILNNGFKLSYLEQWFVDNILIPYKLGETYDIINEYCLYPYFLDFAFINIKLDIELDGRCHFKNGIKRLQHDINRNENIQKQGWTIYRISYKDVNDFPEKTINDFINYLNNMSILEPKTLNITLFEKYSFYKKIKNELKLKKKKEKINKQNKLYTDYYKKLKGSSIDFTKIGWKQKAADFLGITRRQLYTFLNASQFINNENCFVSGHYNGRNINNNLHKRIISLIKEYYSSKQIIQLLNCCWNTIHDIAIKNDLIIRNDNNKYLILQYDINENYIKTYLSPEQVYNELHITKYSKKTFTSLLFRNCKNNKEFLGYKWKHKDVPKI